MKNLTFLIATLTLIFSCQNNSNDSIQKFVSEQKIISQDITHFWQAYDKISSTTDSLQQLEYFQTLFLDKASPGQQRMIEARNYSAEEYLNSIRSYPQFWNSIRKNTENLSGYNEAILSGLKQFTEVYPNLEPAHIYYTVGAHRSPGTGVDSMVLIGTEYALGDTTINVSELPEGRQNYYKINPTDHLSFLTVHEYVHTQQKPMVHNLLSLALYEGIAEFVAIKATGQASPWKAFDYGPKNEEKIRKRFEEDMFKPDKIFSWLWNSADNEFETRDLGYFVGYQIADKYYDLASDKQQAIKTLIELDYNDEDAVEKVVDTTGYFSQSLEDLYADYQNKKPRIVKVEPNIDDQKMVDANTKEITLHFSEPMDIRRRGFDFGPLGEDHVLRVQSIVGWTEDKKAITFGVKLEPGKHYQSTITAAFRSEDGYPLQPYLLELKTR